ncbi:glycoside hydrolase superfamily [Aspergillus pseudoustus]|uniref:alpha-galactosidase n=1 Tax=Aspergillus pseudoustus TaxID=1810923 RepID=A0ABR4KRI9_9EURO
MVQRLDLAQRKGCDGVDPDNVDGYDNENGLGLTQADTVDYMKFLAQEARDRGLSIGLKNAGAVISDVISVMHWSVNEQCAQYDECDTYAAFVNAGKPVFHIEYPKGDDVNNERDVTGSKKTDACNFEDSGEFSTLIKNMDLDNWYQDC